MRDNGPAVHCDERRIDEIFTEFDHTSSPGVTVGIAIGGVPVYRRGFGLACIESRLALSPTTRLRVASVSKQFTCLAYLLLCEDGKSTLDDPIGEFLPEIHPMAHKATLRQLMAHTSGLRDVYCVFDRFNEAYLGPGGAAHSVTSNDLLSMYCDIDDVESAPGAKWNYNNGGYLLISFAIERICGMTLERMMEERIFHPIGMYDTQLLRSETKFIPNRGGQHVVSPDGGYERMDWGLDNYFGAGAVVSTIDDLLRWMAHMDAPRVGKPTTWREMMTTQRLTNGRSTLYGLGLKFDRYRGADIWFHTGHALGGSAQVLKVPAVRLDVAVLSNRQDVWSGDLANKVLDACLPWLAARSEHVGRELATGVFRSPTSGRLIQLQHDSAGLSGAKVRQIASLDGIEVVFDADKKGVLRFPVQSDESMLTLTLIGDSGRPSEVVFSDFGDEDVLVRVAPCDMPEFQGIVGCYRSISIRTDAIICDTAEGLALKTVGRFGSVEYRLESLGRDIWSAKCTGRSRVPFIAGVLSFDGRRSAFAFSSYQMRSIPFLRCA